MAIKYKHSTAEEAARTALAAGVKQLVLGHYSSRYEDETILLNEARAVFENTILSDEMAVIDVWLFHSGKSDLPPYGLLPFFTELTAYKPT